MNAREIIEAEATEWIETWQKLRPASAARIEAAWQGMRSSDPNYVTWLKAGLIKDESANFAIGSTQYEKRNGEWYRRHRAKNPAYWSQPQYFIMAPGPGKFAFIVVKMPRALNQRLWRSACAGIYQDATGRSWNNVYGAKRRYLGQERQQVVVDGTEEDIYNRRASGQKPEPAYEILADGTWKKTSP